MMTSTKSHTRAFSSPVSVTSYHCYHRASSGIILPTSCMCRSLGPSCPFSREPLTDEPGSNSRSAHLTNITTGRSQYGYCTTYRHGKT